MSSLYAAVLAGGRGERFWPLSTSRTPKQMLSLVGTQPLIADAVERLQGLVPCERILVITHVSLVERSRELLPQLPPQNVVGEPQGRDTAAACALAAALVEAQDPEAAMCVLTADHVIGNAERFQRTLRDGACMARKGRQLIVIAMPATYAATGFGYIEAGPPRASDLQTEFFEVARFVEKPDRQTAQRYLDSGRFYWNSGMFLWTVKAFRDAVRRHCPRLRELQEQVIRAAGAPRLQAALAGVYGSLERVSVDYAIMEKTGNLLAAKGAFAWDDVGTWSALEGHFPRDPDGNVHIGKVEAIDARGTLVLSGERLTALIGVEDLIVVHAPGATLICSKTRAQDVKAMVRRLAGAGQYDDLL